jgi:cyanophycinase-like exopeptidase
VIGTVCLQGGGEFRPAGGEMDTDLLRRADGPVVVAPLASPPGAVYRATAQEGVQWFRSLGALDVTAAPDARESGPEALYVLRSARLLVLPGGSPTRLLAALQATGAAQAVADVLAGGGVVMGASAGAMVLGSWTVLPDAPGGPTAAPALGLVPGVLVVPHWTAYDDRPDWMTAVRGAVPEDVRVLGLPEASGVVVTVGGLTAVGAGPTRLVREGQDLAVGQSVPLPVVPADGPGRA